MSLIVIGEAATKIMDGHSQFAELHTEVPWRLLTQLPAVRQAASATV